MARVLTGIVPTTELELINAYLSVLGEAKIDQTELETPTRPDTEAAIAVATELMRETLLRGWRFNTEFGFQISSSDTYAWTGTDASTATLLIFQRPSDLLRFDLTETSKQHQLDVGLRPPRDYTAAEGVLVFYDREENRDGFESADVDDDSLYITGTFAIDFEDCPESFRQYIKAAGMYEFQARMMGSDTLSQLAGRRVSTAWKLLVEDQGLEEKLNIFDNTDTLKNLGIYRQRYVGYSPDDRNSPRAS